MVTPRLPRFLLFTALGVAFLLAGCAVFDDLPGSGDAEQSPTPTLPVPPVPGVPGVSDSEVKFGQSVDFGEIGTSLRLGIQTAFNEVNSRGGVNGRHLNLITLDDGYEPAKAIQNTERFINQDDVFAILGSAGTPTGRAVLPITREAGIPYVAPYTGAQFLRETEASNVINLRASYAQEAAAIVDFLLDKRGFTRIGVVYQDDAYGRSGYSGVIEAMERHDMKPAAVGLHTANTNAVKTALLDLASAYPQAVILIGSYEPVAAMIEWARRTGMHTQFYTVSVAGNHELVELLGNGAVGVYATQVVPLVAKDMPAAVAVYENALRAFEPNAVPNFYSLEGYLAGRLAIAGLTACGDDINRACLLHVIGNSHLLNIDGFRLRFGEDDNQGSDAVYLTIVGTDGVYHPVETLVESVS